VNRTLTHELVDLIRGKSIGERDLHRASVTHPGCVVVPTVLALGARQKMGGIALLTAVLHGFEAMCRVGNGVGRAHYKIWHNTATCGPFGSAMAAATLLQLTGLGFTGPPAILEGDKGFFAAACPDAVPTAVIADAGAVWQLRQTSIKPWPSCRHTHTRLSRR